MTPSPTQQALHSRRVKPLFPRLRTVFARRLSNDCAALPEFRKPWSPWPWPASPHCPTHPNRRPLPAPWVPKRAAGIGGCRRLVRHRGRNGKLEIDILGACSRRPSPDHCVGAGREEGRRDRLTRRLVFLAQAGWIVVTRGSGKRIRDVLTRRHATEATTVIPTGFTPGPRQIRRGSVDAEFDALQAGSCPCGARSITSTRTRRPSSSSRRSALDSTIHGVRQQAYEERFLFLLLLLRQPRARLIYVTSQAIHPDVVDYYLDLLPGRVLRSTRRSGCSCVSPLDGSPRPLTQKLLERPQLLEHIRSLIPDPDRAHLVPFNTTTLERDLAVRLGIPMYGADPRHFAARHQERRAADLRRGRRAASARRRGPAVRPTRSRRRSPACGRSKPSIAQRRREAERRRVGRGQRDDRSVGLCRRPATPANARPCSSASRAMQLRARRR